MDNGSHPIEFHVWRADESLPNVYHLVGMNVFQDAQPDANRLISFTVPPGEQITVSSGDFVGIRTVEKTGSSAGEVGFGIQFEQSATKTNRQYFRGGFPPNSNESFSTPTVLDLRPSTASFSSRETLSPFGSVPVISVTVFGKMDNFTHSLLSTSGFYYIA